MGIEALLIGISLFEVGMLYWLLCGTVLEKRYFQKKDWVILCVNIVSVGVGEGINRSLLFFSQNIFLVSVVFTCICVVAINGQNKLLKTIIVILYYTIVALIDFFVAFMCMTVLRNEFENIVYVYANSFMESMLFICARLIIAVCICLVVKQRFNESYIREYQRLLLVIMIIMCLVLRRYQIEIVRMMYEGRAQEGGTTGLSLMGVVLITLFTGIVYLKNKTLEKESDTCSLLGKLLDNAIEACMRMDDNADKWISVKIENQKQLLFIKIENSVNEAPVMEKGKPVSVKKDKMRHGYGLKNVERILNKYDGTIAYLSRDKAFQVKLLFL